MLVVVAVEAAVTLGALGLGGHGIIGGDGSQYAAYARNLVDRGVFSYALAPPYFPSVLRTPGYPLFLAMFRVLWPGSLLAVRIGQFGLLLGIALLVGAIARPLFGRGVALLAAVLCASYLPYVWLSVAQLSEVLATFLLMLAVWLTVRAAYSEHGRTTSYGLLGTTIALLAMVRPEYGLVVVPAAVGLVLTDPDKSLGRRLRRGAVLILAFVAVMAPWTVRNFALTHRFLPFGANSGQSLYVSAAQYAGRISHRVTPAEYRLLYGPKGIFERLQAPADAKARRAHSTVPLGTRIELAENAAVQAAAFRMFRRLSPGQVVASLPARVAYLWGTADYPPQWLGIAVAAHRLAEAQWALIIIFGLLGVLVGWRALGRDVWPLLLFPAYVTGCHLVFHAEGRYSLPPRPCVMIFAALGLIWLARRIRHGGTFGYRRPRDPSDTKLT